MNNIYVKDIIEKFDGELLCGNMDETLENFSKDTRIINKDDVYVGIKGEVFNGNDFYKDAFDKGAKVCILEKGSNYDIVEGKTIVLVDNSIEILQKLASYKRSLYDIPVVAITGSVGKTSTKDIISHVLSKKYNVQKTSGNYNNHIGLPMTILGLKDHNALVVEMGMNNLGEINKLSNIAKPTIAVITNIGTAHIGNLGSRENILKAKLEIIDGMDKNGVLFINNDNDLLNKYLDDIKRKINVVTFGINNKSDYMASNIVDNIFSSDFKINNINFSIDVAGLPFIYNSLAAYSIGKYLNISDNDIKDAIKNFKLTANRMEKITIRDNITLINDTYNASYDSVVAAIDLINKTNNKRKILLLGDILELGSYSKEIHEKIGNYILNKNIDVVILVGNEVKYIENILKNNNFNNVKRFDKESDTYNFLDDFLSEGDILLIKGSHGINLINVVNYLRK